MDHKSVILADDINNGSAQQCGDQNENGGQEESQLLP